jgi:uncharacterized protein DUF2344
MNEFVQRWRIEFQRGAGAEKLAQRELTERWLAGLDASGLPGCRLVIAVPLPVGMEAKRELADLWLTARKPIAEVRSAVGAAMPGGLTLVTLYDVWAGEAALPGRVAAADYRIRLAAPVAPAILEAHARDLLAASTLRRERAKGDRLIGYDLRPLLADIGPVAVRDGATEIDVRVRHLADLGVGRPEEVVAALGDRADELVEDRPRR